MFLELEIKIRLKNCRHCYTVALCVGVGKSKLSSSSSEWSSELSRRAEVAKGEPKLGTMATRIRAKQSATCGLGAQARAGLCPSSSSASKLAPLAISSCTTGTRPFLADKCRGLWARETEEMFKVQSSKFIIQFHNYNKRTTLSRK